MTGHFAERIDDVPCLHRANRHRGEKGIELKEVFLVDEEGVPVSASRARLSHGAGDVEPRESTAQNQKPSLGHGGSVPHPGECLLQSDLECFYQVGMPEWEARSQ